MFQEFDDYLQVYDPNDAFTPAATITGGLKYSMIAQPGKQTTAIAQVASWLKKFRHKQYA
jgi:hypothetical protein